MLDSPTRVSSCLDRHKGNQRRHHTESDRAEAGRARSGTVLAAAAATLLGRLHVAAAALLRQRGRGELRVAVDLLLVRVCLLYTSDAADE